VTQQLVTLSHSDHKNIIFSMSLFRLTPADYPALYYPINAHNVKKRRVIKTF